MSKNKYDIDLVLINQVQHLFNQLDINYINDNDFIDIDTLNNCSLYISLNNGVRFHNYRYDCFVLIHANIASIGFEIEPSKITNGNALQTCNKIIDEINKLNKKQNEH